ncbi:dihydrodipicolinate reductase [Desulfotignum balticum]|jgi:4-hydroxy-tetrahydrodipicolinate reductase|uniref:dihydrodipicolinate reductase n=1 Tax=Desulfotignum balticum TaxID=115781 RepID=UPI000414741A|nr:dihydrodipicolinate reductase [Desulfotignum balticum]
MDNIFVMINGLPGNVAATMARAALSDPRFQLIPASLTGPDICETSFQVDKISVTLIKPDERETAVSKIRQTFGDFIAIDYTHPSAVNANARFYIQQHIPFVMGTTGGDRAALEADVSKGEIPAVIAPNMAKQIVGFQAMMAFAADQFPGLFTGYSLEIKESHQQEKADTSGTAKAMVGYFNRLGLDFKPEQIQQIRDPKVQKTQWHIPEQYLSGHGWHTYTLTAPDGSALFEFKHNINGRQIYVEGTFDAVLFLKKQVSDPMGPKRLYTMMDVLNQQE